MFFIVSQSPKPYKPSQQKEEMRSHGKRPFLGTRIIE
jgi:hypothetical protein